MYKLVPKFNLFDAIQGDNSNILAFVDCETPWWLTNDLNDDIWYFKYSVPGSPNSSYTVNWNYESINSSGVSVGRFNYWKNYAKILTYHYMESELTECSTTTSLSVAAREFRTLCNWLCNECKCQDVKHVNMANIHSYENYIKSKGITVNSVLSKLIAVRMMWNLGNEIGSGLQFDPYVSYNSMKIKAKKIGRTGSHTKTLKPDKFFLLINHALQVINDAEMWLGTLDYYLECHGVRRKFSYETGISYSELQNGLFTLYGASLFLILSLTAERKHELASTSFSHVMRLLNSHNDELVGVEYKTSGTLGGKTTLRPVIKELNDALEVIIGLTKETRISYMGDQLILKLPFGKYAGVELTGRCIYNYLDYFSRSAGMSITIRPHMLRRAFSMVWTWRYEVGDLYYLSKMLYHNSAAFTRIYVDDEDIWEFMPEAEQALAADVMEKALLGEKNIYGGFGKVVNRLKRRLHSSLILISPDAVHNYVKNLFNNGSYKIVAHADGYCFISPGRGRKARCSTDGFGPNYSNRNEYLCYSCANFCVDHTRKEHWANRIKSHKRVLDSTDIDVLRIASSEACDRAEQVLRWMDQ